MEMASRAPWLPGPLSALILSAPLIAVEELRWVGVGAAVCAAAWCALSSEARAIAGRLEPLGFLVPALTLIVLYCVAESTAPIGDAQQIASLAVAIAIAHGLSHEAWGRDRLLAIGAVVSIILIGHGAHWIASGAPARYSGLLGNPNGLGTLSFLALFPVVVGIALRPAGILSRTVLCLGAISGLAIMAASMSRASWLAAVVAAGVASVLWSLRRQPTAARMVFVAIMAAVAVTSLQMGRLSEQEFAPDLNREMFEATGKRAFSGRELMWPFLEQAIRESPWWGYGPGATPEHFTGDHLSAHNLYLAVALQVGLVGVALLVLSLYGLWRVMVSGISDPVALLSASWMAGILVEQSFEVALTQNNLAIGIPAWAVMAIGVSRALQGDAPHGSQVGGDLAALSSGGGGREVQQFPHLARQR